MEQINKSHSNAVTTATLKPPAREGMGENPYSQSPTDYYSNLYWINKLNMAWSALKQKKSKKSLQEFLIAYQNSL